MQYFVSKLSEGQSSIEVVDTDAHHMINVKRIKINDEVKLFNGHGLQVTAVVESVDKKIVSLKIKSICKSQLPTIEIVLNFVPPKGKNLSLLIEKSVEVGVDKIVPLVSERSIRSYQNEKSEKLNKIILEACKQSERAWIPELLPIINLKNRMEEVQGQNNLNLFFHPRGGKTISSLMGDSEQPRIIQLFIGPEGGWSEFEIGLAEEKKLTLTTMTCPIMRVETAVIASISVIRSIYT
ncbi:MAG: hypothetical protein COA79_25525 [Planctomycetota bacterium]|nr:MAG: hypothetical protein COA79_25525 [Planctomycetota bacterium]